MFWSEGVEVKEYDNVKWPSSARFLKYKKVAIEIACVERLLVAIQQKSENTMRISHKGDLGTEGE